MLARLFKNIVSGAQWRNANAPNTVSAPGWAKNVIFAWPPAGEQPAQLPETAIYDLEHQTTTFDFATWICTAKTLGATRVHFAYEGKIQDWKYPAALAWKRFGNIVLPLCELMNLPWTLGPRNQYGFTCGYHSGYLNELYKQRGWIAKFPLLPRDDSGYITVTIRESFRNKYRDSSRADWDRFIAWLEASGERVIVIEDLETKGYTLDVSSRMRLYSNAKMNFGVNNGPMALCHYSEAPYIVANMIPDGEEKESLESYMVAGGFGPDSQYAFRNSMQTIVWKKDTFDNLVSAYQELMQKKSFDI